MSACHRAVHECPDARCPSGRRQEGLKTRRLEHRCASIGCGRIQLSFPLTFSPSQTAGMYPRSTACRSCHETIQGRGCRAGAYPGRLFRIPTALPSPAGAEPAAGGREHRLLRRQPHLRDRRLAGHGLPLPALAPNRPARHQRGHPRRHDGNGPGPPRAGRAAALPAHRAHHPRGGTTSRTARTAMEPSGISGPSSPPSRAAGPS